MRRGQKLIVALGTNIEQERNMRHAMGLLVDVWQGMRFTTKKWTDPIGIESDKFYNAIGFACVDESLGQVEQILKDVEGSCGDTPDERAENRIHMDVDILLYGSKRLHNDDWQRSYINALMDEVVF